MTSNRHFHPIYLFLQNWKSIMTSNHFKHWLSLKSFPPITVHWKILWEGKNKKKKIHPGLLNCCPLIDSGRKKDKSQNTWPQPWDTFISHSCCEKTNYSKFVFQLCITTLRHENSFSLRVEHRFFHKQAIFCFRFVSIQLTCCPHLTCTLSGQW